MLLAHYAQLEAGLADLIGPVKFSADINLKLERIALLLDLLGNPQAEFASLHVGGTSGKTSTAVMSAAMLHRAGLTCGLHTSPHLQVFNERHQIDGRMAPTTALWPLFQQMQPLFDEVDRALPFGKPSYFEAQFALSCLWFAQQQVDVAVIEVGLGGTLDATNVIAAQVAVITSIGLDHTEILGDTIQQIATDKAGIIKPGQVAFTAATQPEARAVIAARCEDVGATLHLIESPFGGAMPRHLDNGFQRMNAACALAATRMFAPGFAEADATAALDTVRTPGRMEIVQQQPLVVLDGAHNPDKMAAAARAIGRIADTRRRILLLAMKRGKDVDAVLTALLPLVDQVIATEFVVKGLWHPVPARELAHAVRTRAPTLPVRIEPDPLRAVAQAVDAAQPDDLVWVTGSLYLVGDVRERWFSAESLLKSAEQPATETPEIS